jgi:hypothetical protein
MQTLTPWQPPDDLRPTPALKRQLERRVLAPARRIGEELSLVAITEPPPPVSIMHPPQGGTWIAARADCDPVAEVRGALHAPEAEIARLAKLYEAGVDPDVILVGHQLPDRWQPGDPVPAAYLPAEVATVDRLLATQAAVAGIGFDFLRTLAGIRVGLGAATAAGISRAADAVAALDPFLLFGTRDTESGLIGWTFAGAWDERPAR